MPSAFRTPKNLPEWVELDFYRRHRGLRCWKRRLTWGALSVCIFGGALALLLPGGARAFQAGPLSPAHAMFNDDCSHCHQGNFQTAAKFFGGDAHSSVVDDQACSRCHSGPAHNAVATPDIACAQCHREHRGRTALARVPDGYCTDCHADLTNHRQGGSAGLVYDPSIHSFTNAHPEFRIHAQNFRDPGRLHFNHQVHLNSEGILGKDRSSIVLQCVDCHQTDVAGRYMQPIQYEEHCKSCHPLSVRLVGDITGADPVKLGKAVRAFNSEPAPHRDPTLVRAVLRDRLLLFAQSFPVLPGEKVDPLFDPGLFGPRNGRTRAATDFDWRFTDRELKSIEKALYPEVQRANNERMLFDNGGGCRYCHMEKKENAAPAQVDLPTFEKTDLPTRWMVHARFSHLKHRMLECTECHAAPASTKASDVLMPTIDSCRRCHNEKSGVRDDCAMCHTYHDRSTKHDPHKGMTIEEFGK